MLVAIIVVIFIIFIIFFVFNVDVFILQLVMLFLGFDIHLSM